MFGALLGRFAPLGWGNLGAALLDPFEQGAGDALDLVVAIATGKAAQRSIRAQGMHVGRA